MSIEIAFKIISKAKEQFTETQTEATNATRDKIIEKQKARKTTGLETLEQRREIVQDNLRGYCDPFESSFATKFAEENNNLKDIEKKTIVAMMEVWTIELGEGFPKYLPLDSPMSMAPPPRGKDMLRHYQEQVSAGKLKNSLTAVYDSLDKAARVTKAVVLPKIELIDVKEHMEESINRYLRLARSRIFDVPLCSTTEKCTDIPPCIVFVVACYEEHEVNVKAEYVQGLLNLKSVKI